MIWTSVGPLLGPLDADAIVRLATAGRLRGEDLIAELALPAWRPLREVDELWRAVDAKAEPAPVRPLRAPRRKKHAPLAIAPVRERRDPDPRP